MSQGPFPINTFIGSGSVTAPGAGVLIADIGGLVEGIYDLELIIALTGTAETALRNVRLEAPNGTQFGEALPTLTDKVISFRVPRIVLPPAATGMRVMAVAAATAGSIYNVLMTSTRLA